MILLQYAPIYDSRPFERLIFEFFLFIRKFVYYTNVKLFVRTIPGAVTDAPLHRSFFALDNEQRYNARFTGDVSLCYMERS